MDSLGSAIRSARVNAELSQGELAQRLGVSQSTISFWERDIEIPTLDHVVRLVVQFPGLLDSFHTYDQEMIQQLRQIERLLFKGKCACENCQCNPQG